MHTDNIHVELSVRVIEGNTLEVQWNRSQCQEKEHVIKPIYHHHNNNNINNIIKNNPFAEVQVEN